jgi:hypothetical protein
MKGKNMDIEAGAILLGIAILLLVFVVYKYHAMPEPERLSIKVDTKTAEAVALLVQRVDGLNATVDAQAKLINSYHQEIDQFQDHLAGLRKELQLAKDKKIQVELTLKSPIPVRSILPQPSISEAHPKPIDPKLVKKLKGQLKELGK